MPADLWSLYRQMLKSRLFERAIARLWEAGEILGEMHLGTGEEAIAAGVVARLEEGDALALDHRGTPPLLMRGVDPALLLREFLGRADGLCGGMGGHMHLFAPELLAASSGVVGSSGPAAVGFALAATHLRPGKLAVAFFGEGATNEGMMLESFNLAVVWKLPVLFVCKDNGWAISTRREQAVGGALTERARGFGLAVAEVDGSDVEAVWQAAGEAIARARAGQGPSFLLARCARLDGHFLGDALWRNARRPAEGMRASAPLLRSISRRRGASWRERIAGLGSTLHLMQQARQEQKGAPLDPLRRTRPKLLQADGQRLRELEGSAALEIEQIVATAKEGGVQ
jgi:TPP-dependent pyruvate/acetoin dehydrogenase alpha subunit